MRDDACYQNFGNSNPTLNQTGELNTSWYRLTGRGRQ